MSPTLILNAILITTPTIVSLLLIAYYIKHRPRRLRQQGKITYNPNLKFSIEFPYPFNFQKVR